MRVLQGNEELLERKGWDGMNSGRGIERARPAPQIIERAKRVLVAAGASRSETLTTRQARRQYAQPPFFLPPFASVLPSRPRFVCPVVQARSR